jgi:hypothetical protein
MVRNKNAMNVEEVQVMVSQFVTPSKQQLRVLPWGEGAKAQTNWSVPDPSHQCDGKG